MNYADENFYTESYLCGKEAVINTAFDFYSRKASTVIRTFTGNNIDENNIPEYVKMCCCEVAESLLLTLLFCFTHRLTSDSMD